MLSVFAVQPARHVAELWSGPTPYNLRSFPFNSTRPAMRAPGIHL